MRVAILIVDDRFALPALVPQFGAAPTALLQGFSTLFENSDHPAFSIDVISCTKWKLPAPYYIAPGIRFHQLVLPDWCFLRSCYLGPIIALSRLLARLKPDIVHAQGTESWCAAAALFSGISKVLTLHGCLTLMERALPLRPQWYWIPHKMIERAALRRFNAVFCSTRYVAEGLATICRAPMLVANAVRSEFFTPPPLRDHCGTPLLLNVGVIQPRKRQVELCEVFHRLAGKGLRFRVRFIGRLGMEDPYSEIFQEHLERGSAYLEHIPEMDVEALVEEMDLADALIHSPMEEAFGLVAAEALARNLPAFLADIGGLKDISLGVPLAFTHRDLAELESQLVNFLFASDTCGTGNTCSQGVIAERYHPEVIARQHLAAYSNLIHAV